MAPPQFAITLKQIAAEVAESHDLPKTHAEAMLDDLVAATIQHLNNRDKIRLTGLGILPVRERPARMCRNPATGEAIQIKAIAEFHKERQSGKVSSETELHLKHVFRKCGWDTPAATLAAAVGEEINRLEREAATLRKLRADLFAGG